MIILIFNNVNLFDFCLFYYVFSSINDLFLVFYCIGWRFYNDKGMSNKDVSLLFYFIVFIMKVVCDFCNKF